MDSPRLRRRNSIMGLDPRRRSLLRQAHKSNPHIGWSHHFPDPSYLSQHQQHPSGTTSTTTAAALTTNAGPSNNTAAYRGSLRASPYVGWFRHAPSTVKVFTKHQYYSHHTEFYERQARQWLQEEIRLFLAAMPHRSSSTMAKGKEYGGSARCLEELLSMRLVGGNDKNILVSPGVATSQGSLMLLQMLRTWFSFSMLPEDGSSVASSSSSIDQSSAWNLKSLDQEHLNLEDEISDGESESEDEKEEEDYDALYEPDFSSGTNDEPVAATTTTTGNNVAPDLNAQNPLDIGISSQAEAYYAHQVTNDLTVNPDDHTTVLPTPSSSRLDYVITQLDIVRMHRNASRHLDVESIYKLPTITYRAHSTTSQAMMISESGDKSAEGWSWMFIPEDKALDNSSLILGGESAHLTRKKEASACVICMEAFADGNRLRVLPCNHSFHVGCIDRWLSGSCSFDDCHTAGCPVCKKRPDAGLESSNLDGSVPSWAFAQLGRSLARECSLDA